MIQTDRRVRRTHKLLGDALIALALEKFADLVGHVNEIVTRHEPSPPWKSDGGE